MAKVKKSAAKAGGGNSRAAAEAATQRFYEQNPGWGMSADEVKEVAQQIREQAEEQLAAATRGEIPDDLDPDVAGSLPLVEMATRAHAAMLRQASALERSHAALWKEHAAGGEWPELRYDSETRRMIVKTMGEE